MMLSDEYIGVEDLAQPILDQFLSTEGDFRLLPTPPPPPPRGASNERVPCRSHRPNGSSGDDVYHRSSSSSPSSSLELASRPACPMERARPFSSTAEDTRRTASRPGTKQTRASRMGSHTAEAARVARVDLQPWHGDVRKGALRQTAAAPFRRHPTGDNESVRQCRLPQSADARGSSRPPDQSINARGDFFSRPIRALHVSTRLPMARTSLESDDPFAGSVSWSLTSAPPDESSAFLEEQDDDQDERESRVDTEHDNGNGTEDDLLLLRRSHANDGDDNVNRGCRGMASRRSRQWEGREPNGDTLATTPCESSGSTRQDPQDSQDETSARTCERRIDKRLLRSMPRNAIVVDGTCRVVDDGERVIRFDENSMSIKAFQKCLREASAGGCNRTVGPGGLTNLNGEPYETALLIAYLYAVTPEHKCVPHTLQPITRLQANALLELMSRNHSFLHVPDDSPDGAFALTTRVDDDNERMPFHQVDAIFDSMALEPSAIRTEEMAEAFAATGAAAVTKQDCVNALCDYAVELGMAIGWKHKPRINFCLAQCVRIVLTPLLVEEGGLLKDEVPRAYEGESLDEAAQRFRQLAIDQRRKPPMGRDVEIVGALIMATSPRYGGIVPCPANLDAMRQRMKRQFFARCYDLSDVQAEQAWAREMDGYLVAWAHGMPLAIEPDLAQRILAQPALADGVRREMVRAWASHCADPLACTAFDDDDAPRPLAAYMSDAQLRCRLSALSLDDLVRCIRTIGLDAIPKEIARPDQIAHLLRGVRHCSTQLLAHTLGQTPSPCIDSPPGPGGEFIPWTKDSSRQRTGRHPSLASGDYDQPSRLFYEKNLVLGSPIHPPPNHSFVQKSRRLRRLHGWLPRAHDVMAKEPTFVILRDLDSSIATTTTTPTSQ